MAHVVQAPGGLRLIRREEPTAELAAAGARAAALEEASRALRAVSTAAEGYAILGATAARLLAPDVFLIGLFSPAADRLRIDYLVEGDMQYPPVQRSPVPHLYRQVAGLREPMLLSTRDEILSASGQDLWRLGDPSPLAHSALFVPLLDDGVRPLGLLSAQSYLPNAFGAEDVEAMARLAVEALAFERRRRWRIRNGAQASPAAPATAPAEPAPDLPAPAEAVTVRKARTRVDSLDLPPDNANYGVVQTLIAAVDDKDRYTRRHAARVTALALMTADTLNLPEETRHAIHLAGLLLDVGKIAVPDAILQKSGALTDEEMGLVCQHPVLGAMIVHDVASAEVMGAIRSHHERWDGRGYPDALVGEAIPFLGRLFAVADSYGAMRADRPYRPALTPEQARAELLAGSGGRYDPAIVDAFLRTLESEAAAALLSDDPATAPLVDPAGD